MTVGLVTGFCRPVLGNNLNSEDPFLPSRAAMQRQLLRATADWSSAVGMAMPFPSVSERRMGTPRVHVGFGVV